MAIVMRNSLSGNHTYLMAATTMCLLSCVSNSPIEFPADIVLGDASDPAGQQWADGVDESGTGKEAPEDSLGAHIEGGSGEELSDVLGYDDSWFQEDALYRGATWDLVMSAGVDTLSPASPDECVCPGQLPVCFTHTIGETTSFWCTATCEPSEPGSAESCETLMGDGACCREDYSPDGILDYYCFPAEACCTPCGDLCCPPGTTCEGEGEACVPLGAQYCADGIWCTPGMVCAGDWCCPEGSSKLCGGSCCPNNYDCIDEVGLCMPPEGDFCGGDDYCPPGTKCYEELGLYLCIPLGHTKCEQGHWCPLGQVCSGGKCCSALLPNACGPLCCGQNEICINDGEACVPEGTDYCGDGVFCPIGYHCAPDKPICVPDTADYCGSGVWCKPGQVCAGDGCCPQGLPQKCGSMCCFGSHVCTEDGLACMPPASDYCGAGKWCPPGTLCAEGGDICYPVGGEYCGDGHWCDPGLNCAGDTCCAYTDAPGCGKLCCPAAYECVNDAEACIPPGADYCGNGKWCNPGLVCKSGGGCMIIGSKDCGEGVSCKPGTVCVDLLGGYACCPKTNSVGCLDKCCPTNYECAAYGEKGICIPPGATYCGNGVFCFAGYSCGASGQCMPAGSVHCDDGTWCMPNFVCNEGGGCCPVSKPDGCGGICCPAGFDCVDDWDVTTCLPPGADYCGGGSWCPSDMKCPKYGDKCVPVTSDECPWGGICGAAEVCAVGAQKCCPKASPMGCGSICCPSGFTCEMLSAGPYCLAPGGSICPGTELICPSATDCSPDGLACVPPGADYCGKGKWCTPGLICSWDGKSCGSPLSEYCGQGLWCGPGTGCMPDNTGCMPPGSDYCGGSTYCNPGSACSGPCDKEFCCPPSAQVQCIDTCALNGTVCYHAPKSATDPKAYQNPDSGHYTISGEEMSDNMKAGVYHAELDAANWIENGQKNEEILFLEAAWIIDNAEGDGWPHGPYASIYLETGNGWPFKNKVEDHIPTVVPGAYTSRHLRGPHCCVCPWEFWAFGWHCAAPIPHDEWIDNEYIEYSRAGVHRWLPGQGSVVIKVWESDPAGSNDTLGIHKVVRNTTASSCGTWIPLYKDASSPNQVTWKISGFLLLRTFKCTGKSGDPC